MNGMPDPYKGNTLDLSEDLERGKLSADKYARLRADRVGRADVFRNLIRPILSTILRRMFRRL